MISPQNNLSVILRSGLWIPVNGNGDPVGSALENYLLAHSPVKGAFRAQCRGNGEGAQPSQASAFRPRTFPDVSFKLLAWQSDAKAPFEHNLLQLRVFAP